MNLPPHRSWPDRAFDLGERAVVAVERIAAAFERIAAAAERTAGTARAGGPPAKTERPRPAAPATELDRRRAVAMLETSGFHVIDQGRIDRVHTLCTHMGGAMQRMARDQRVALRVREEARRRWVRAAAAQDTTLSDWLRKLANEAAPKPRRARR